jgi:hypothetical protein
LRANIAITLALPSATSLAAWPIIGGGEDIDLVAGLDALAHAPGGAEFGAHGNAVVASKQGGHVGHRLAQAAGAVEHQAIVLRRRRHRQGDGQEGQQGALSEVGQHIRSPHAETRNIWRISIYTDEYNDTRLVPRQQNSVKTGKGGDDRHREGGKPWIH